MAVVVLLRNRFAVHTGMCAMPPPPWQGDWPPPVARRMGVGWPPDILNGRRKRLQVSYCNRRQLCGKPRRIGVATRKGPEFENAARVINKHKQGVMQCSSTSVLSLHSTNVACT